MIKFGYKNHKQFTLEAHLINHFEVEKNKKALLYTIVICALFLMIAILYTWPLRIPPIPTVQDLIDVNLGNEQEGMGDVQPLVKGDRAQDNQSVTSKQSVSKAQESPSQHIQADEEKDEASAPVVKSENKKETAKELNKDNTNKTPKNINPSPVPNPNPAPPAPKVPTYKGGSGTGGNGATEDNGYRNQGYNPGGKGDAGSPDGKPDAYGDTPGGKSGISVFKGLSGRRPLSFPSMTDNFNENAKVFVDIKVDASGNVISAVISKGTTTSNSSLTNIALTKAKQLKFPGSQNDVEMGTILFDFKVKE